MRGPALLLLLGLVACGEPPATQAIPDPAPLTRNAVGHYCGMLLVNHTGPKGQIFISGSDTPLWFSSVRDTLAFTLLPEETDEVRAIYVNDMAWAESWASPETWMRAQDAFYVIGSSRRGGMGAQEAVPFSSREAAADFVVAYGGRIVGFSEIPRDYILGDA